MTALVLYTFACKLKRMAVPVFPTVVCKLKRNGSIGCSCFEVLTKSLNDCYNSNFVVKKNKQTGKTVESRQKEMLNAGSVFHE